MTKMWQLLQISHTYHFFKSTIYYMEHIRSHTVKIIDSGLYFYFLFFLNFIFCFVFLFLEQLGLGFISHAVTSVTNWWHSHKTNHGTWENEVEGIRIKWRHTAWITHAGLMLYSWSFRVGCTVASTDHGY